MRQIEHSIEYSNTPTIILSPTCSLKFQFPLSLPRETKLAQISKLDLDLIPSLARGTTNSLLAERRMRKRERERERWRADEQRRCTRLQVHGEPVARRTRGERQGRQAGPASFLVERGHRSFAGAERTPRSRVRELWKPVLSGSLRSLPTCPPPLCFLLLSARCRASKTATTSRLPRVSELFHPGSTLFPPAASSFSPVYASVWYAHVCVCVHVRCCSVVLYVWPLLLLLSCVSWSLGPSLFSFVLALRGVVSSPPLEAAFTRLSLSLSLLSFRPAVFQRTRRVVFAGIPGVFLETNARSLEFRRMNLDTAAVQLSPPPLSSPARFKSLRGKRGRYWVSRSES